MHFIGIGGIGVSALARAFLHWGWRVSGSDSTASEITDDLKRTGIQVYIGNHARPAAATSCDLIIYSLAVRPDNPQLIEARRLGIKTQSYPEALGEITKRYFAITVSGSHGKSTTAAILALITARAGFDPTVILGTKLKEFGNSNFRPGKSSYLILEADEWARAFLHYFPTIAIVTNIDREHLDTYKNLSGVKRAFAQYAARLPKEGYLILNKHDNNSRFLTQKTQSCVVYFGIKTDSKPFTYSREYASSQARIKRGGRRWPLQIPGIHNQINAEAAWQAAKLLGVKKSIAREALSRYRGAWRRMEQLKIKNLRFKINGGPKTSNLNPSALIYSDYAHHPTEIKATLAAFREKHPNKKLLVIYQPHQIDRLTKLFNDFVHAFDLADELWLLPTYQVAGREYRGRMKTSKELAEKIDRAKYFPSFASVIQRLQNKKNLNRRCIIFMGAGDIDTRMREFFTRVAGKL